MKVRERQVEQDKALQTYLGPKGSGFDETMCWCGHQLNRHWSPRLETCAGVYLEEEKRNSEDCSCQGYGVMGFEQFMLGLSKEGEDDAGE